MLDGAHKQDVKGTSAVLKVVSQRFGIHLRDRHNSTLLRLSLLNEHTEVMSILKALAMIARYQMPGNENDPTGSSPLLPSKRPTHPEPPP